MLSRFSGTIILILSLLANMAIAGDRSLVEVYGQSPIVRALSISPDGKHYAYIQRGEKTDLFLVVDIATGKVVGGTNSGKVKASWINFVTNDVVIFGTSRTRSSAFIRGKLEHTNSIVYNINTRNSWWLTERVEGLFPAQSGLGRIVAYNPGDNSVYAPVYLGREMAVSNLMKISLRNGKVLDQTTGNKHTIDWFVDHLGNVIAREDFDRRVKEHRIYSRTSGDWELIYSNETDIPTILPQAISSDGKSLIFEGGVDDQTAVFSMSLIDGETSEPLYGKAGTDIELILTNGFSRSFAGVRYSGMLPSYEYNDANRNAHYQAIQAVFPGSSVHPVSATQDWSKVIFLVSGNQGADDYYLYNSDSKQLGKIASKYPDVKKADIGNIRTISYEARDGTQLNAVMTLPAGDTALDDLPMLVFPHGGPASYDRIEFDWWAQYFARRGYLVFQPNFRGSTGFGISFQNAGDGEWGKAMQDDITDGVQIMISKGFADRKRICIMGASYGGYAALAGGAFTPDLYRCVISVAGVSDLTAMLRHKKFTRGSNHWVMSYLRSIIGDPKVQEEKIQSISPANFAAEFKAPVLLLHGNDDSVVPITQSKRMRNALKDARKPVEYVRLKNEDHWLSNSETRLQLLKEISKFLDKHNPANKPSP